MRLEGIDVLRFNKKVTVLPLGARVMVKPIPEDEYAGTSKLIVRPDVAKNKPLIGRVIAIGEGHKWDSGYKGEWPPVEVGDVVIYGRYAGYELAMEDEPEVLWPRVMGVEELLGKVTQVS